MEKLKWKIFLAEVFADEKCCLRSKGCFPRELVQEDVNQVKFRCHFHSFIEKFFTAINWLVTILRRRLSALAIDNLCLSFVFQSQRQTNPDSRVKFDIFSNESSFLPQNRFVINEFPMRVCVCSRKNSRAYFFLGKKGNFPCLVVYHLVLHVKNSTIKKPRRKLKNSFVCALELRLERYSVGWSVSWDGNYHRRRSFTPSSNVSSHPVIAIEHHTNTLANSNVSLGA